MKIFETHAHLYREEFDKDRANVMKRIREVGVEKVINIGCDENSSRAAIKLAEEYPFCYATVGWHPQDVDSFDREMMLGLLKGQKVVAVGEIGLEYYRMPNPKKLQQKIFAEQIEIAKDFSLPIVIHDRDAHEDTLRILQEHNAKNVVFHCFAGNVVFAEEVLNSGYHISITGRVTRKKFTDLRDVVRMLPKDRYFVETDSPFLAPKPYVGKRNASYYLPEIISEIAQLRMQSPKEIAEQTYKNACNFFLREKL